MNLKFFMVISLCITISLNVKASSGRIPFEYLTYEYYGCYKEDHPRTLPIYLGDVPSVEECARLAYE